MTKREWNKLIDNKIVILDGATASNLMSEGMPSGVSPELWILQNQEVFIRLQMDFIRSGSDILYAPTFTSNRIKLREYGLEDQTVSLNKQLFSLSMEAVNRMKKEGVVRPVYVAGDLTMTGQALYPVGTLDFEELVSVYKEQAESLIEAGADLFVIETMMSLAECRAALLAVKECCDLPVMVTLSFEENLKTLYGTSAAAAAVVLESMGADAVGVNCSQGAFKLSGVLLLMNQYVQIPLIAKPNAGLPKLVNGAAVYDMDQTTFAGELLQLIEAGARIVGGCCGTTPGHIKALEEKARSIKATRTKTEKQSILATEREILPISLEERFMIVGERINPTGKKVLKEQLKNKDMTLVIEMAEEQEEQGASILDINVGMNGINEVEMMQMVLFEVMQASSLPICLDSSNISVLEHALRVYPGRALVNSVSLESEKIKSLLPIVKKYGAMFILLPLSDRGLPKDMEEKRKIIHEILDYAYQLGFTKEDIVIDGLVTTVSANKSAAVEVLETIRYAKEELSIATICGLSNISFGLPERAYVNSAFLTMAISAGLTMAIANPSQELIRNQSLAAELLCGGEGAAQRYIERTSGTVALDFNDAKVYQDVLKGKRNEIVLDVKTELSQGTTPSIILDQMLIPAINQTGLLFEQKKYFLPQLIASAEAMRKAVDYLEPMLMLDQKNQKRATIVLATVAGDIHDIGKNLVALLLKNYGYRVIDLGKDVKTEDIIKCAKEEDADIIGLSALMTTTMIEMKKVVKMAKEEKLHAKIIVGGAVVTQSFADEIGADGYSEDAKAAVSLVERLI